MEQLSLSGIISQLISYGIVFGAIFNQLPQIYKILKEKSFDGLSISALQNECILFWFNIVYNLYQNTDFLLYGENCILFIENVLIILLFLQYNKINYKQIGYLILIIFSILFLGYLCPQLFSFTIYINLILLLNAKLPQIKLNYQRQNTGQLAFLTHLQNQAGALPRAFTIFLNSEDFLLKILMIEDNILVLILSIQFLLYWNKRDFKKQ